MIKSKHLFIGVDGGATKSIVRVEDEAGKLLAREAGGPANIRISVPQTWEAIHIALEKALHSSGISKHEKSYQLHAGMGLAGCEIKEAYHAFLNTPHPFATLRVTSDAHTACLGAHGGKDGAIIIIGTGVVGFQLEAEYTAKVGGWGFPHDDEGGGAWLGLEAVRLSLQGMDGRLPESALTKAVLANFGCDNERMVAWASRANSTAFAELAPLVIQQHQAGDTNATQLLRQAARAVDRIGDALNAAQINKQQLMYCSLVGGLAAFIQPLLGPALRSRLSPSQLTPDAGAVFLVRHHQSRGRQ